MSFTDHFYDFHDLRIGYKLSLPKTCDEPLPLILFLHGMKKRGTDLRLLDDYGFIRVAKEDAEFQYVVVAPQCPEDKDWPEIRDHVLKILEEVISTHFVDRGRVFLTGFSMGGNGVWDLAANTNGVFAAAATIAGWYNTEEAKKLTSMPIWAFHGDEDDVVPVSATELIVHAIMDAGGTPRFTKYTGIGHQHTVMYVTYANPELYAWFESNRKTI